MGLATETALDLAEKRCILEADVPAIVRAADEQWDNLTNR